MSQEAKPHYKDFFLFVLLLLGVIILSVFLFSKNTPSGKTDTNNELKSASSSAGLNKNMYTSPPSMQIDTNKKYTADMVTGMGTIGIELFAKETPQTVNNFVFLSREGFYDGTPFHRIIKGFMIQGGDPNGNGTGGPGYKFADEKITRDYKRGIVAMANSGPNTNGSQFFIMHQDNNLPKNYVIFGQVVKGMDVVDKIADVPVTESDMGEQSVPTEKVTVEKVTVSEQ